MFWASILKVKYKSWLSSPSGTKKPRLCLLRKWSEAEGYGFNLQSKSDSNVCYVSEIDTDSPSDYCGLKALDNVFEVNGQSVSNLKHEDIVNLVRSNPAEVELLVADQRTMDYYNDINCNITRDLLEVDKHTCPHHRPGKQYYQLCLHTS